MSNVVVRNYYRDVLKKSLPPIEDPLMPLPNKNWGIFAQSGAGKSNLVPAINNLYGGFDKIYLWTGTSLDEPIYAHIAQKLGADFEGHEGFDTFCSRMSEINRDKSLREYRKLIIIDDFLVCPEKTRKQIGEFLTWGRKLGKTGATTIILSQSWFDVPKLLRLQLHYICLMRGIDKNELKSISRSFSTGNVDSETIYQMYHDCTKTMKITDFMFVDRITNFVNLKWRKGFSDPFIIQPGEAHSIEEWKRAVEEEEED